MSEELLPTGSEDWNRYQALVMSEIARHEKWLSAINKDLAELKSEVVPELRSKLNVLVSEFGRSTHDIKKGDALNEALLRHLHKVELEIKSLEMHLVAIDALKSSMSTVKKTLSTLEQDQRTAKMNTDAGNDWIDRIQKYKSTAAGKVALISAVATVVVAIIYALSAIYLK